MSLPGKLIHSVLRFSMLLCQTLMTALPFLVSMMAMEVSLIVSYPGYGTIFQLHLLLGESVFSRECACAH